MKTDRPRADAPVAPSPFLPATVHAVPELVGELIAAVHKAADRVSSAYLRFREAATAADGDDPASDHWSALSAMVAGRLRTELGRIVLACAPDRAHGRPARLEDLMSVVDHPTAVVHGRVLFVVAPDAKYEDDEIGSPGDDGEHPMHVTAIHLDHVATVADDDA